MASDTYNPAGSPTVVIPDGPEPKEDETEFDRFKDLAEKLVNTPKPKADDQPKKP